MRKFFSSTIFFAIAVAVVVFIVYGKSVNFDLLSLDDKTTITNNLERISKAENIPEIFKTNCYDKDHADIPYYRPIFVLTFALETILFGFSSKIYHFGNLQLFCFAIYIMYFLLLKLDFNETISKCVLLLFAVHPIISSNAAYVSTRAEILIAIFILLAFFVFISYLETKKTRYLILQALFYTIALFTKETALIFFPLFFVFSFLFKYKVTIKEYIKLFIYLLVPTVIYFICRSKAVPSSDFAFFLTNPDTYINFFNIMVLYIRKFVFPDHIHAILFDVDISVTDIIISGLFVILLFIIYYKKLADRRLMIFSFLTIVGILFPTVFLYENQVFYHRLFLPLFFLAMIFIQATDNILKRKKSLKKPFAVLFVVIMILFSFKSFINIDKYINSDIFWLNAYKDAPNYHLCSSGLAKQYFYAGEYDEALKLFKKTRALKDTYENSLNISAALIAKDNLKEAKELLLSLLEEEEHFVTIFYLSEVYYYEGDIEKAVKFAKQAYAMKPNDKLLLKHIERLPGF